MQTYIALLRGINVSGQKQIKMADLKTHLQELNFQNIKTYIQSGNIIFSTEKSSVKTIEKVITKKIKEKYGWDVPVLAKTPQELLDALEQNPFPEDRERSRIYFTFLAEIPSSANLEKLKDIDYSPEEFIIKGKNIYFYSPNGYGNAKMNNNFFENKLKVAATTRNWKTVETLVEMVKV